MTPKEKAVQIVREMNLKGSTDSNEVYRENAAQRCALVAVDEIIKSYISDKNEGYISESITNNLTYWQQVRSEIESV